MRCLRFICVLFGLACISMSAHAKIHALIMTISEYQAGIPQLRGVKYDAQNARDIAHSMGVKDEDIRELHDQQLTLRGMNQAFDDLIGEIGPNDDVFIYYSGHGGRQYIREPVERCAESLITVDGYGFTDSDLKEKLDKLSGRARKMVVLLDACHSGGAISRSLRAGGGKSALFESKYWSKGDADACAKPVNVLTRSITRGIGVPGSGAQNYIYIAAARDNEVSFDQPGKGGVATQAWMKCIESDAHDVDGSGAITAEEVRQCAQQKIDLTLKDAPDLLPHHIVITGNSGAVMKLDDASTQSDVVPNVAENSIVQPSAPAAAQTMPAASISAVPPAPTANAGASSAPSQVNTAEPAGVPYRTLQDIYNNRDDRRLVTLRMAKQSLRIGQDTLDFTLTSSHAGYVYLLMVGSDGQAFDMLFPNKIDGDNYLEAGQQIRLPRPNWQVMAQGPEGKDHLLVIVADAPRDFSSIGMTPSGPFSTVDASQSSVRSIQVATDASANATSPECAGNAKSRNIAVAATKCSDAYGAALATVEEAK
jgi:hypothetical protein